MWVSVLDENNEPMTIHLESCGVFVGGKADEVAQHIQALFKKAQGVVMRVREILMADGCPLSVVDQLVPVVDGGVRLHKLLALIHDTCSVANRTAADVEALKQADGTEYYGSATWNAMPKERTELLNNKCNHHLRQLPVIRFNKLATAHIKELIGSQLREAAGFNGRFEPSPSSLVLSVVKLVHSVRSRAYSFPYASRLSSW